MRKCVVFGCWNPAPTREGFCLSHRPHRDSGGDPQGENARSAVEGEASQSGGEAASPNPSQPRDLK
jgi:hypothetical protein